MTLLKDETTMRLDELGQAVDEASALYEDLRGRAGDAALAVLLERQAETQRRWAERFASARRGQGELPQAGDPERAHLQAAAASVRAFALPGHSAAHYARAAQDAAAKVRDAAAAAAALELAPALQELVAEMHRANGSFAMPLARLAERIARSGG